MKFANEHSQSRSQYKCTYQICENPLRFTQVIVLKVKYGCVVGDNSVKNRRNLPIQNPKADLHNINAHTKFGEKPFIVT